MYRLNAYGDDIVAVENHVTFDYSCDLSGYYNVTPAPFPLTGFLATITNAAGVQADFGGSSPNFAGTNRDDVVREIESHIMDGN